MPNRSMVVCEIDLAENGKHTGYLRLPYSTKAAGRLDSLLGGYDLATLEKEKGPNLRSTP
jgi:hypothetical protein